MINNIRIAPNELYSQRVQFQSQKEDENAEFGKIINSQSQSEKEAVTNKISLSNLGAPAGFFADISMLSKEDADALGIIQFDNTNPYSV